MFGQDVEAAPCNVEVYQVHDQIYAFGSSLVTNGRQLSYFSYDSSGSGHEEAKRHARVCQEAEE